LYAALVVEARLSPNRKRGSAAVSSDRLPVALLVDDADDTRLLLAAIATRGGFRPVTARNGREALDVLEAGLRPAVIITDVEMPVMTGLELLQAIRSSPTLAHMPVIVHSSHRPSASTSGRRDAADLWVRKPADPAQLLDAMRRVV